MMIKDYRRHMTTLKLFSAQNISVPASTSWYLADLGEFRGQQELYMRQSPQRLKALREHALIESAVSSNRIEGVSVDPSRVREVLVAPKPLFRDRDEEEVRGYRDALKIMHESVAKLPVSEVTIRELHRLTRGQIWDAGQYKEKDGDIIERYPDGRERVRFRPASAAGTCHWGRYPYLSCAGLYHLAHSFGRVTGDVHLPLININTPHHDRRCSPE